MNTLIWFVSSCFALGVILFAVGYIAALLDLEDVRPQRPQADYRVLILGYHPALSGGVTAATRTLLDRMPEARLLPIKHCYGIEDWVLYGVSLAKFMGVLCKTRRPLVAHLIVASRGDRVRGIAPILLCKLFRVPICAHYHTNWANMSFGGESKIRVRTMGMSG